MTVLSLRSEAQVPGPPPPQADRPRVFLDCSFNCDFDHFRREIGFVDWVRDRSDADVHALGTSQETGGGGEEYIIEMIGLRRLSGWRDTLHFVEKATDTESETRAGLTHTLSLGLVRFTSGFGVAQRIGVSYKPPEGTEAAAPAVVRDPWNFWVFSVHAGGSMNGEQQQGSFSVNGSANANPVTERLKVNLYANGRYSRSRYELDEDSTYTSSTKDYSQQVLLVASIGQRWSVGGRQRANRSTYLNRKLALTVGPALEYSLFPYRESSRRQMTFTYLPSIVYYDYEQLTIFGKTRETLPVHEFQVNAAAKQPWGSVDAGLSTIQYLHDPARHRIELNGEIEVRLAKGLSFSAYGEVSRIKDQLHLSAADLSPEDILLQRRQQGTDYSYYASFGLSYSFGSIFNNVVNPRMNDID